MSLLDSLWALFKKNAPVVADTPAVVVPSILDNLGAAIQAAAPRADLSVWLDPLTKAFSKVDNLTPRKIAAALGQFSVEAGEGFTEVIENTNYTHGERLVSVFRNEFPTLASTVGYVGNPKAIANRAYAFKLGNGNEASGDGWKFRGRSLIQITGRDEYSAFANAHGMTPEEASVYLSTKEGAAEGGVWYFTFRNIWGAAEAWDLATVTRRVNGSAMLDHAKRVAASNAALGALGGT